MKNLIVTDPAVLKSLTEGPAAPAPTAGAPKPTAGVEGFVSEYLPLAQRVGERLGVEPHLLLGQWGLETGWGKSVIPGTNNLGNIKDPSGRGAMATDNMTGSRDAYRQYGSADEFGEDFAGMLGRLNRYRGALGAGGDAQAYFTELKRGGYAEDPDYIAKGARAAEMARNALGGATRQPAARDSDMPTDFYVPESMPGKAKDRGLMDSAVDLGRSVVQGARMLGRNVMASGSTALGNLSDVELVAESQRAAAENDPQAKKALMAEIQRRQAEDPNPTLLSALKNVGGAAAGNLEGTAQLVVEQAPNAALVLGGGAAGAKMGATAGAAFGPVGALVGGGAGFLLGMFMGNALIETGAKAIEKAEDGFTEEDRQAALAEGATKAGVITAVDALTFKLGTMIPRAFSRGAVTAGARAEAKVLADAGVDIADGGAIVAALRADPALRKAAADAGQSAAAAAVTTGQKAGSVGTGLVLETVGEGAGEGLGEYAATGEYDPYNIALESLMGLAQSGPQAVMSAGQAPSNNLGVKGILQAQADSGGILSKAVLKATEGNDAALDPPPANDIERPAYLRAGAERDAFAPRELNGMERAGRQWQAMADQDGPGLEAQRAEENLKNAGQRWQEIAPVEPAEALRQQRVASEAGLPWLKMQEGMAPEEGAAGESASPAASVDPLETSPQQIAAQESALPWLQMQDEVAAKAGPTSSLADSPVRQVESMAQDAQQARPRRASPESGATSRLADSPRRRLDASGLAQAVGLKGASREGDLYRAAARSGFDTIETREDGDWLLNLKTGEAHRLPNAASLLRARKAVGDYVRESADAAAPSPRNARPEPTDAQKKAGNYAKGHLRLNGFDIAIENPRDSVRSGTAPDGTRWESRMAHDYGYIKRTTGADKDQVDVFIGPRPDTKTIFVVDQVDPATGLFDESKALFGFRSAYEAREGYLANYEKGWQGLGSMVEMTPEQFGAWVKSGNAKLPASDFVAGAPKVMRPNRVRVNTQAETAAVASLSQALGEPVRVADPRDEQTQALGALLDAWANLTGKRGIAVTTAAEPTADASARSSGGFDGLQLGNDFFVNVDRPQMHVAQTIAHEFKHMTERSPAMARLYERIWSMISEQGRREYYEGYLAPNTQGMAASYDDATPADLERLKSEMVADFFGQRFNDRAWLQQLARQKPALFGDFVRDWLRVLNSLIGRLKALAGQPDLAIQQKKNIDQYIAELEEAKAIAAEVAAEWAQRNAGLAQKAGIEPNGALMSAREGDEFPDAEFLDEDLEAMLQEELQAEMAGGFDMDDGGDTFSPAALKRAGIMAEELMGELPVKMAPDGMSGQIRVPDFHREGKEAIFLLESPANADGLWAVSMGVTWVGPAMGGDEGFATLRGVKDFVRRLAAGRQLGREGFDLAKTIDRQQARDLTSNWRDLADIEKAFRYTRPPASAKSIPEIAAGLGITEDHDVKVEMGKSDSGGTTYNIAFRNRTTGESHSAVIEVHNVDGRKHMTANTVGLGGSGLGGAFYQMAAEMAARRNTKLSPDSQVSGINSYRRTEQMISAALRIGKSNAMVPHFIQRIHGFNDDAKTVEQHNDNLVRLLLATMRNVRELAPELADVVYHLDTSVFTMPDGSSAEQLVSEVLARTDARAFGLGRAQIARASLTRQILEGKLKAPAVKVIGAPILYSARDKAAQEYQAVLDAHRDQPTWMKAPNGMPTRLSERQWVQVRTPSFKAWFGDWERFASEPGGVWADEGRAVSKAVHPDTGEPLVLYHGTDKGGFMAFQETGGERRGDLGIFTTSNYDMARSYVRRGRIQDVVPPSSRGDLEDAGYQFEELEDGRIRLFDIDGYEVDSFASEQDAVNEALRTFTGTSGTSTVYAVFANLRDVMEQDFQGAAWSGSFAGLDKWEVYDANGDTAYASDGSEFMSRDQAVELAMRINGTYEIASDLPFTSDSVARDARRDGLDGAILQNIVDDGGGGGNYYATPADVHVVFDPANVKSAEWNTGDFSAGTSDMRFSPRTKSDDLMPVAERGERQVAARTTISAAEKAAIQKSAEKTGLKAKDIEAVVRGHKAAHPTAAGWAPLEYSETKLKVEKDKKGKEKPPKIEHVYKTIPYSFNRLNPKNALEPGSAEYVRRVGAISKGMVEEVRSVFRRAEGGDQNARNILAQAGWYKAMRSRLRHEFGGLGDLFADLLGATSPNTPVRDNWFNAVDSLRRATRGDFDDLIIQWDSWAARVDQIQAENRAWFNEQLASGLKKKQIFSLPEYKARMRRQTAIKDEIDDLLPTKENDAKYGFNGKNVARAMVDLWRIVKDPDADIKVGGTAPKALNFSGNLIGFRSRATIDVWAARMLQRLAGGKRIPSMAEDGVTGEMLSSGETTKAFGMGQDIFARAADAIRTDPELATNDTLATVNDDDLQAIVWFVEKELWTVNNWTSVAGEGGSFELEANLTGSADQDRIRALRKIIDSSKSTAEQKRAARASLVQMERTAERYSGGLSIQMSADTQGVDFVPTDADMARLINDVRTSIYEGPGARAVLASKAASTEGRYGGIERALDLEVVVREGYDATPLWRKMVEKASEYRQDATYLSRALRDDEAPDFLVHRPGIEIYFREQIDRDALDRMLAELAGNGVEFLTVVVDGRRMPSAMQGGMPPAVGVRVQYVPEFMQRYGMEDLSSLDEAGLRDHIRAKALEMKDLAASVASKVPGVSFGGQFWYETQVAFLSDYKEILDANPTRDPQAGSSGPAGQAWSGQPIREGLGRADRHAREAARRESERLAGPGVVGGDALDSAGRLSARDDAALRGGAGGRGAPDGGLPAQGSREAARDAQADAQFGQLSPLPGAPRIQGFTGPDPRLVATAERYARENGITLRRQAEYVKVDPVRAQRIAAAYEAMPHAPSDPRVKEAYDNLIRQTIAQYRALESAGYRFWFIDLDAPGNIEYVSSPWNAMREIRESQVMGVFPTSDGFGSGDALSDNPLETTVTEFMWPSGSLDGPLKPVLANDLFRAVHDAFGHGLEGAGFRAQGEENAWQAHVRLFTGSAVGAITSETRGQNSWLNYGPHGEHNRDAKVEDTIFADQKTGLMPEWTWTEGRVGDADDGNTQGAPRLRFSARTPGELFFSELSRQIEKASMKQAQPAAWKTFIKALSSKGVKADEVEWTGVNEWLDLQPGKVTRDELLQYLQGNGVQVAEVVLGAQTDRQKLMDAYDRAITASEAAGGAMNPSYIETLAPADRLPEEQALLDAYIRVSENPDESYLPDAGNPKYGQYTLPGGTNYREVLLTLPMKLGADAPAPLTIQRREDGAYVLADQYGAVKTVATLAEAEAYRDRRSADDMAVFMRKRENEGGFYRSGHWDQPNVLAHIRLNDRTDADGARVLFVEEVQSDWGQEGKKKGFARDVMAVRVERQRALDAIKDSIRKEAREKFGGSALASSYANLARDLGRSDELRAAELAVRNARDEPGPPLAPFVTKTEGWLNLALKRIIAMAVDEGYDKVAFVTGEQSADRYSLSRQVDQIRYQKNEDGTFDVWASDRYGSALNDTVDKQGLNPAQIEEFVGKEVAQKIIDGQGRDESGDMVLEGVDLKVGGEGMKTFYNAIVPNAAKAMLKKLGGGQMIGVEFASRFDLQEKGGGWVIFDTKIGRFYRGDQAASPWTDESGRARIYLSESSAERAASELDSMEQGPAGQPGFEITDAMREKVAAGLPLFSARIDPQTKTDAFKRWFGESKVREEMTSSKQKFADMPPRVVYHATNADFSVFESGRPTITSTTFGDVDTVRHGIFFAEDVSFAEGYLKKGGGQSVIPAYLSIQNPLYLDEGINGEDLSAILSQSDSLTARDFYYIEPHQWWGVFDDDFGAEFVRAAQAAGFDGVRMVERNPDDRDDGESYGVWVAFRPEQIKSAIGNDGTFDPANPDIRFSKRDTERAEKAGFDTSKTWYHGTVAKDFKSFRMGSPNRGVNELGAGIYFTGRPDVAEAWAGRPSDGGRIIPAYLKKGDIFDSSKPVDYLALARRLKERNPVTEGERRAAQIRETKSVTEWTAQEGQIVNGASLEPWRSWLQASDQDLAEQARRGPLNTWLDRAGYIGRKNDNSQIAEQVVVFRPEYVRAPWAKFSPAKADSGNLLASAREQTEPDIRFSAWDAPAPSRFDDFVYKTQDKLIDLKRVTQSIKKTVGGLAEDLDAYLQEELFHGRAAKRTHDFGVQELQPLMEQIAANGLTIADVEEYLHARHAKEANRVIAQRNPGVPEMQDGGSGMEDAEVDAYFARLSPADRAKLDAAAARVDDIIRATRQLYVSYGLESQDTVDGWESMFQHYIPLQREDKDGSGAMGIGQGFSVKGKETKGRTGSKRKVVDILANIAMQRERLIVRGEKNRVALALLGMAAHNPNPDFWQVGPPPAERVYDPKTNTVVERVDPMYRMRDNVIMAKVRRPNGAVQEMGVVFNEDDPRAMRLAGALKNLDAPNLEGLLGISAKITRYFAAINTQYNPVFGVVNLIRDVQGAMVNLGGTPLAGQRARIAKDTFSALVGIYGDLRAERKGGQATSQWAQLWDEFQNVGGKTGFRELFRTSQDRAEALQAIVNPDAWADGPWGKVFTANGALKMPVGKAKRAAEGLFNWLSDYNEALENGVRLSAYKAGLDQGMSKRQAASLAKNLTVNFNRKGQVGAQAGAVYAFFNAAMQGTARMGQVLFDMDGGDLKTLRLSKTGKKVIYGGVLLGVVQALALAAAGFDEEDPPGFVRERSLVIPIGDKKYLTIPMPLGLHVIPGLGRHMTEFALSGFDKPAQRAADIMGMLADSFNPIGHAGLSMQTLAPTALDPLVALTENRDWTGKPIARTSMNEATPGHALYKDTASTWSKALSEAVNWVTGGNEYVAGVVSPTPDQIDYLIGQITGGVGREISKLDQTGRALVSGEELPTFKMPLVGRFIGDAKSQASEGTAFYANTARLNELETEVKGLRGDGRMAEAQQLLAGRPDAYLIAVANTAERQIQRLRREKRALVEADAPREQVKAIEDRITDAMRRLNRAVEQAETAQRSRS